jgi:hypothetical protein
MPTKRKTPTRKPRGRIVDLGWWATDDPRYGNSEQRTRRGRVIYKGSWAATDPRYTGGGWRFILGTNLNPHRSREQDETSPPLSETRRGPSPEENCETPSASKQETKPRRRK